MKIQTRPKNAFDIFKEDFKQSISNLSHNEKLTVVSPARLKRWIAKKIYQKKLE